MDDLTTLLERKQYDLVVSLTEGCLDAPSILCRVSALLQLNKASEAMSEIKKKREILYKSYPLKTLKANFEIRFLLKEFEEAYEDEKVFSNFPYVSQEVEEYLRALPGLIRSAERQSSLKAHYGEDDIREVLEKGQDYFEIMSILANMSDGEASLHSESIASLLMKTDSELIVTYGLLLLTKIKYPKKVSFRKKQKSYILIPCDLTLPYLEKDYVYLLKSLEKNLKDPSTLGVTKNLLNNLAFEFFPESVFAHYERNLLLISLEKLAYRYLGMKEAIEDAPKYGLSASKVEKTVTEIEKTIKDAERLKI